MRRKLPEASDDTQIDMTPMLDVVFIMLIFFIVTATFVKEPGVEVSPPFAVVQEKIKPVILIGIAADDTVWIDGREIPLDSVKPEVAKLNKENPKGGAEIQVDKAAKNGTLLKVLEDVNDVGVPTVHVKTAEN